MKKIFSIFLFALLCSLAFSQPVSTTVTSTSTTVTVATPVNSKVMPICEFNWAITDGNLRLWQTDSREQIPGGRLKFFTINGVTDNSLKDEALGAITSQCNPGVAGSDTLYLPDGTMLVNGDTILIEAPDVPLAPTINFGGVVTINVQEALTAIDSRLDTALHISVEQFGLKGDYRSLDSLAITSADATLTAPAGTFASSDVGKTVVVWGAGTGTDGFLGDELITTIASFTSTSSVELSANATVTVTLKNGSVGTNNTAPLQAMLTAGHERIEFTNGQNYFFGTTAISIVSDSNLVFNGNGARIYFISSNPNSYITGSQPLRHWINANASTLTVRDFEIFNIGQTQARPTTAQEGSYYTTLNGGAVTYNRRYNKTANAGAVVYNTNGSVVMENVTAHEVGTLHNYSGASSAVANTFENCLVLGWGQVGLFPGPNSTTTGNYFDNSTAPVLSSTDQGSDLGTSHGVYVSGGYDNIKITDNTFKGVRYYGVQYETSGGAPSRSNDIGDNTFINCWSWLVFSGNNSEFYANVHGGSVSQCGSANILMSNAKLLFDGIHFDSTYTNRSGAITISAGQEISVKNCHFFNINDNSNQVAILVTDNSIGIIDIANCYFDSTVFWAAEIYGDANNFTRYSFHHNESYAPTRIANSVSGAGSGSLKTTSFTKNLFHKKALQTKVGVLVEDNDFDLKDTDYGITAIIDATADSLLISKNTWRNNRSSGSANLVDISTSASTGRTIFSGNTVYGAYNFSLGAFAFSANSMFNFYYTDRILKGGGNSKLWVGTDFSSGSLANIVTVERMEIRSNNSSSTAYMEVGKNGSGEWGIHGASSTGSTYVNGGGNSNLSNGGYIRVKGIGASFGLEMHGGGYNIGGNISLDVWAGTAASTNEIPGVNILHTSGNVGVGTAAPTSKLDIIGTTQTGSGTTGTLLSTQTINSTSGTTAQNSIVGTFAAGAGSASYRPISVAYTINNSGAQSGTATGIFLNATETALNSMGHNLADLQVGSASKFKVTNAGVVTVPNNGSFGAVSAGNISFDNNARIVYSAGTPTNSTEGHVFTSGTIASTSGTTDFMELRGQIASGAGSGNVHLLNAEYTINNPGAQSGTMTGIFLNATETALNSMTHNLMDLQVGGSSKFKVTNTGSVTASFYTGSTQALSGAGAANVTTETTKVTTTGLLEAITLADGVEGQTKTILHDVDGGSFVLTPTTKTGWTTFTSTVVGESITLRFVTTRGWIVIGSYLGVIAL